MDEVKMNRIRRNLVRTRNDGRMYRFWLGVYRFYAQEDDVQRAGRQRLVFCGLADGFRKMGRRRLYAPLFNFNAEARP